MNEGKNEGFPREVSKIQFPRDNAFYEIHIFKHLKFTNEVCWVCLVLVALRRC